MKVKDDSVRENTKISNLKEFLSAHNFELKAIENPKAEANKLKSLVLRPYGGITKRLLVMLIGEVPIVGWLADVAVTVFLSTVSFSRYFHILGAIHMVYHPDEKDQDNVSAAVTYALSANHGREFSNVNEAVAAMNQKMLLSNILFFVPFVGGIIAPFAVNSCYKKKGVGRLIKKYENDLESKDDEG
jgi:hypothetical protein